MKTIHQLLDELTQDELVAVLEFIADLRAAKASR